LTIESAQESAKIKVDLLITHHDAWEWMSGMKEEAFEILKQSNITHFFIHAPLDDAEFGNNTLLLKKLVNKIEMVLEEPVRKWKNNERLIKKIGVITGAGFGAIDIKDAANLGCDVYFTGEKILYTVQYAKYRKINLIVGSHTFTEIFGLESLVEMINKRYPKVEIIKIKEEHIE